MSNTFNDGDICWVKKYGIKDLERYEVVIAKVNNKYLIKRVVGLPGEKIRIDNGKIYINGNVLEESYSNFTEYSGIAENEYLIDNESYFLLDDNREYSVDSRYFGSVSKKNITGVVIFRFYPFTNIGPINK